MPFGVNVQIGGDTFLPDALLRREPLLDRIVGLQLMGRVDAAQEFLCLDIPGDIRPPCLAGVLLPFIVLHYRHGDQPVPLVRWSVLIAEHPDIHPIPQLLEQFQNVITERERNKVAPKIGKWKMTLP